MHYLFAFLIATAALGNSHNSGSLVISIEADVKKRGNIHVAVFQNETAFKKKSGGVFEKILPYSGSDKYRLEVPALAYGRYSVAVFQDLNGNGRLDANTLGIPTEPYGFSNNPKVKWSAPTFDETAVSLKSPSISLSIAMKTWKQQ
ncbi:MAG: DUF2141 domain-containing protein [Saprospiraceae bacterium]|nr:DUF2141 domain-containing protein [Saprospiraceae bacterium]